MVEEQFSENNLPFTLTFLNKNYFITSNVFFLNNILQIKYLKTLGIYRETVYAIKI